MGSTAGDDNFLVFVAGAIGLEGLIGVALIVAGIVLSVRCSTGGEPAAHPGGDLIAVGCLLLVLCTLVVLFPLVLVARSLASLLLGWP